MSKGSWESLSATQAEFIDYIREYEKKSGRIIFYKHDGHFGAEFAILSRYPKINLLTFKELKRKTGKNLVFRILHILAAIGTFVLNVVKKIDARTSVSTILANAENIYLGIDKEKEYLKYLKVKKNPHKYTKVKFVVCVEENDIESDKDISCLKLLCKLIQTGRINNTLLLIAGERIRLLNLGIETQMNHIPLFKLSEDDLCFIAQRNNIQINDSIRKNIKLVGKLGIQFFIDNYMYFEALSEVQNQTFDWIQKMDWIITQMINRSEIAGKELYPLLEFVSFFEHRFSKVEILVLCQDLVQVTV